MRRRTYLVLASILIAIVASSYWLVASSSGLQAFCQLAGQLSGGRLQIVAPSGQLRGPLRIESLRWKTPALQVEITALAIDWSPAALWHGHLAVASLNIGRLQVVSPASAPTTPPPAELILPLAVDIAKLQISALSYNRTDLFGELSAAVHSDGRVHRIEDFAARSGGVAWRGRAELDGLAPLPLSVRGEVNGELEGRALAASFKADGHLERFAVQANGTGGLEGSLEAQLTPFAESPLASARIALANIDPSAWHPDWPAARLSLNAELAPQAGGFVGSFGVSNRLPGALDKGRLPVDTLAAAFAWQGGRTSLKALALRLPGGGELSGDGRWQNAGLDLKLAARRLDLGQFLSMLRSTRLDGQISGRWQADRQQLHAELHDSRFRIAVEAALAGDALAVSRLELAAGDARLQASGEMSNAADRRFKLAGELRHFDPARFARLPSALINATLVAEGQLSGAPRLSGSFQLQDSRLAGQPLLGAGRWRIEWPRVPQLDLKLEAGANRLAASGAFGGVGDVLNVDLQASALQPYGLRGGLVGRFALSGSARQPQLAARLQADEFGWPGHVDVRGLNFQATAGGLGDSPLTVELRVVRLDTPDRQGLASGLHIQAQGSNAAHRIEGDGELADGSRLSFSASGGLASDAAGPLWRGRLLEAGVSGPDAARNMRLAAPAGLRIGVSGWQIDGLQLVGSPLDWRASLQASADQRHLQARLSARGSRIGTVDGELKAGLQGPWALDRQAPWLAALRLDVPDLGWLAELFDPQWTSGGRLSGQLTLDGTPAAPRASGRLLGEQLALGRPAQAMNLRNGQLDLRIADRLLRLDKLAFDSVLQPLPRPLRLAAPELVGAMAKPGRLEISGEMRVDRSSRADSAVFDVHLERVGIFQLPEQWVAVSGESRIGWQQAGLAVRGKLVVDGGFWGLQPGGVPRLSDDVVVVRPGGEPPPLAVRPKLDLDLTADLGRRFLFEGLGLSSRLVGDVRLTASGHDLPRATGSIRTRAGRFDAYGQQLSIERGVFTFQGLLDNPALDVRAVRKGLAVEAGVQVGGTAQRPVIKLVSDPDVPEAEKLAWLVLGHGPEGMGAGDATLLVSAAGGLLGNDSGNVVSQIKNTFGIDEFGVRQGDIGGSSGHQPGSRVAGSSIGSSSASEQIFTVGKRLSSNTLLSYEQALGKAESIVKLTVALSRRVSFVGRAGSDNALDLFYTFSFGRAPPPAQSASPPDSKR